MNNKVRLENLFLDFNCILSFRVTKKTENENSSVAGRKQISHDLGRLKLVINQNSSQGSPILERHDSTMATAHNHRERNEMRSLNRFVCSTAS